MSIFIYLCVDTGFPFITISLKMSQNELLSDCAKSLRNAFMFLVLQIPAFHVPGFTDSGFSCSWFYRFRLFMFLVLQIPAFHVPGFTDSGFHVPVFLVPHSVPRSVPRFPVPCFTDSSKDRDVYKGNSVFLLF